MRSTDCCCHLLSCFPISIDQCIVCDSVGADTRAGHIFHQTLHPLEIIGVQAGFDENRVRLHIGLATRGVLHPTKQFERLAEATAPAVRGDEGRVGLEVGGAALVDHRLEQLVRLLRLLALAEHGDELDVDADVRPVPHLVPH